MSKFVKYDAENVRPEGYSPDDFDEEGQPISDKPLKKRNQDRGKASEK